MSRESRFANRGLWWLLPITLLVAMTVRLAWRQVEANRSSYLAAHAELEHERALASREHIPLTSAEFTLPTGPETANAAPIYLAAVSDFDRAIRSIPVAKPAPSSMREFQMLMMRPRDAADQSTFERYEAAAKPAMDDAKRAAKRPFCDFHIDPSMGNTFFRGLNDLGAMLNLAVEESREQAEAGRALTSLELLAAYAPIVRHIAQGSTLTQLNLATGKNLTMCANVLHVLASHGRVLGICAAAARVDKALGPLPNLERVAECENLTQLFSFQPIFWTSRRVSYAPNDRDLEQELRRTEHAATLPGVLDRWQALQLETTRKLIDSLRSGGDDWLATERHVAAIGFESVRPNDVVHAWMRQWGGVQNWKGYIDQFAVCLSYRRVLAQAIAVFAAWKRTGKLPQSLPLTGVAAHDPLGRGPLRYTPSPGGFTIYAVGPHGVDHGGRAWTAGTRASAADIVFTYPAPFRS